MSSMSRLDLSFPIVRCEECNFSVHINFSLENTAFMMSYDEPLTISADFRVYFELPKTPGHYQGQEFLIS